MSDDVQGPASGELVYMVAGDEKIGDHHIFVRSALGRAEARHREVETKFTDVQANWRDA